MSGRFDDLPPYTFARLRTLLDGVAPGADPIDLSIGEPRHAPPAFARAILDGAFDDYRRYPPNDGTESWRSAVRSWLGRRYGLSERWMSDGLGVAPLSGTREGMFMATLACAPAGRTDASVVIPNPFYQCYAAAALAVGAEPAYLNATEETGFLPDLDQPAAFWDRAVVVFLCTPSNPQGAVASLDYWSRLFALAERHDFLVFADECYSEIYRSAPPVGALEAAAAVGADPERVVAFHSLSKRSNLAGLRSGFAAGGRARIAQLVQLKSYAGAPVPRPAFEASAAVWSDEAHVAENRALYAEKFEIADELFTDFPGYRSPNAGFFLWLPVADGEAAARALWRDGGVKALPGAYLSRCDGRGRDPGAGRLRVALVSEAAQVRDGLTRVRTQLEALAASQ